MFHYTAGQHRHIRQALYNNNYAIVVLLFNNLILWSIWLAIASALTASALMTSGSSALTVSALMTSALMASALTASALMGICQVCHLPTRINQFSTPAIATSTRVATILESICKLQKRAIKIISGIGVHVHIDNLFVANSCNILLFNDLAQYLSCVFMFNVFYNNFPSSVIQSFSRLSLTSASLTRQHYSNFTVHYSRLNVRHNFITIAGVNLWNSLLSWVGSAFELCVYACFYFNTFAYCTRVYILTACYTRLLLDDVA